MSNAGVPTLTELAQGDYFLPEEASEKQLFRNLVSEADEQRPAGESAGKITIEVDSTCAICYESMMRPKLLPCLHAFCTECLDTHFQHQDRTCPTCRGNVRVNGQTGLSSAALNSRAASLHKEEKEEAKKRKRKHEKYLNDSAYAIERTAKRLLTAVEKIVQDAISKEYQEMLSGLEAIKDGDVAAPVEADELYHEMVRKVKAIKYDGGGASSSSSGSSSAETKSPVYSLNSPVAPVYDSN